MSLPAPVLVDDGAEPGLRYDPASDTFRLGEGRSRLLCLVPAGGICAEIGVWKGDFSQRILDTVDPAELHLIDPWRAMQDDAYEDAWYGGMLEHGQRDMDAVHRSVLDRFASGVFVVQLALYGVHELSEARVLPASQVIHDATEILGPDGRIGHFLAYSLAAVPTAANASSSPRK